MGRLDFQAVRRFVSEVEGLELPVPFTLERFPPYLERRSGRAVRLERVALVPAAPSGIFLRTARTDWLFYEAETSPFHQAHIVLSLVAPLLIVDGTGPRVDPVVAPGVSPELSGLILGDGERRMISVCESEDFALLALDRLGVAACSQEAARRLLRSLVPLREALVAVVPEAARPECPGMPMGARFRLHRQVVEVRDAMLAIRAYRDPQAALAAREAGCAAKQGDDGRAASVEAAVLAAAMRAKTEGCRRLPRPWPTQQRPSGMDLLSEAEWLAEVSNAFTQWQQGAMSSRSSVHQSGYDGGHPIVQRPYPLLH